MARETLRSPHEIIQEMLDRTVARIARDPTKIQFAPEELGMLQAGKYEAVFGRVAERELAGDIASSPDASKLFKWTKDIPDLNNPGVSTPGDFIGIGRAEGYLFEVTSNSAQAIARHAARWDGLYGQLVHTVTYAYPF